MDTHTHTWDRLYLQAWLLLARVRSIDGTIQAVLAAQEASREGNGGRNTGGRMKELRKRRERGEGNVCEKRMRADRASRVYSGLEMHGWHVCMGSSIVRLITLVGYVGAMVQYLKPRKYMSGEHEGAGKLRGAGADVAVMFFYGQHIS
jgi:hypothetical protein